MRLEFLTRGSDLHPGFTFPDASGSLHTLTNVYHTDATHSDGIESGRVTKRRDLDSCLGGCLEDRLIWASIDFDSIDMKLHVVELSVIQSPSPERSGRRTRPVAGDRSSAERVSMQPVNPSPSNNEPRNSGRG
jgi:hypothetical protein